MSIVDGDLPWAVVDFCTSIMQAIMGAILMCLSAGYFAATAPVVILAVWGKFTHVILSSRWLLTLNSTTKVLPSNISSATSTRSWSKISPVLSFHRNPKRSNHHPSFRLDREILWAKPRLARYISKALLPPLLYSTMARPCPRPSRHSTRGNPHDFNRWTPPPHQSWLRWSRSPQCHEL